MVANDGWVAIMGLLVAACACATIFTTAVVYRSLKRVIAATSLKCELVCK